MKNQIISLVVVLFFITLIAGCSTINQSTTGILNNEDEQLKNITFVDFTLGGSYFYQTDWNSLKEGTASKEEFEEAYAEIFNYLRNIIGTYNSTGIREDCVDNKQTYECLFVYAVINGKESLCGNFPESKSVKQCGRGGCENVTVRYKDACMAQVRLFNEYAKSNDKINFCKSFNYHFAVYACEIYTALKQNDYESCSDLPDGCYYPVVCLPNFPYRSKEMYECRLRSCEIDSKNEMELKGCQIGANDSNPEIYR